MGGHHGRETPFVLVHQHGRYNLIVRRQLNTSNYTLYCTLLRTDLCYCSLHILLAMLVM